MTIKLQMKKKTSMGQSSSSYQSQLLTELNSAIFNQMLTVQNQNTSGCSTINNLTFVNGTTGVINCATININQTAQVNCTNTANFTTNIQQNIANTINSAISQMAQSTQTATQSFLASAVSANSSSTSIVTHIQNLISTNINTAVTNSCISNAQLIQNNTFTNNGTINCAAPGTTTSTGMSALTINQNAVLQSVSSCVGNSVFNLLANDALVSQVATTASNTQTTTQAGISSLIPSVGTLLVILGIVIVVAIIAGVIYTVYKKQSPQGQAITAATQVASAIATPQNVAAAAATPVKRW